MVVKKNIFLIFMKLKKKKNFPMNSKLILLKKYQKKEMKKKKKLKKEILKILKNQKNPPITHAN